MKPEEKARRYDEIIEKLRNFYRDYDTVSCLIDVKEELANLFPELRESEDERIRRCIGMCITDTDEQRFKDFNTNLKDCLNWLEKQAPVEHFELKRGHWYMCHRAYCCRADYLTVQEGERFECKEDGVVKGFVIKDPEKYFIEVHAPAPMEDDQNDEVRRRSTIQVLEYAKSLDAYNQYGKADIDKNIAWLEKQGTSYTKRDVDDAYIKGMAFAKDELEKQNKQILANSAKTCKDEQKPADKVEPKFKVGDWIVNDYCMGRVVELTNDAYLLDTEQGVPFSCEHNVHLWTIQDAKEGDVLVNGDEIVIFKKNSFNEKDLSGCMFVHCSLRDKKGSWYTIGGINPSNYLPATKAQRDKLFETMKEAGYEWDAEKKELKEIDTFCQENCKGYQETARCFVDGECEAKKSQRMISAEAKEALYDKSAWSEEDNKMVDSIIEDVRYIGDFPNYPTKEENELYDECLAKAEWLKSLKGRYTWKPSEGQVGMLQAIVNEPNNAASESCQIVLKEIIRQMKELME